MPHIRLKLKQNKLSEVWAIKSLNSGNMLTKLEFTGFVGFFFFRWGRNGDVSTTLF